MPIVKPRSSFFGLPQPSNYHLGAVVNQVAIGAFIDTDGDRPAVGQWGGIVEAGLVLEQIVGALIDWSRRPLTA